MQHHHRSQGLGSLASMQQLDVKIAPEKADLAMQAYERLDIALPVGGKYLLKVEDTTLHIYDTDRGISKHNFTSSRDIGGISIAEGNNIAVEYTGVRGISDIVIHSERGAEDSRAKSPQELVKQPLFDEYKRLVEKAASTDQIMNPRELRRLVELSEEITGISSGIREEIDSAVSQGIDNFKATYRPPVQHRPTSTPVRRTSG